MLKPATPTFAGNLKRFAPTAQPQLFPKRSAPDWLQTNPSNPPHILHSWLDSRATIHYTNRIKSISSSRFFCAVFMGLFLASAGRAQSTADDVEQATVREISEKFGQAELLKLQKLLNSPEFQAPLTNYNCGDPVPKLKITVSLRPKSYATTRAVEISSSPGFSPSVPRKRCVMFGLDYLLDKAVAGLDPDPQQEDTREPHCDCSKRDGNEEWVTFPGPTEILATAKMAAKDAARKADEAEEMKEESLSVFHFSPGDAQGQPDKAGGQLITREQSLGKLPAGADLRLLAVDPTFNHWACVVKRNGKQLVVLDGVAGKAYEEIPDHQTFAFSADGKHFAYIAKQGGKMIVVADGREGKAYASIEELFHPRFSPDGKRLAYIISQPAFGIPPETMFAVVDGREQKGYGLVEGLLFSPDSKHVAYLADKRWNRGTSVVLDGKEGKPYDQISGICFSPDGNRLAYVAYHRTNQPDGSVAVDFAVVDGQAGKAYNSVASMRFSPDSKHLVYVARRTAGGLHVLVRDGMETKYADVALGSFSPDGSHLATAARFGTNWLVLVDGRKLEPQPRPDFKDISLTPFYDLTFSPDSRHLAYISRGPALNFLLVLDGNIINSFGSLPGSITFSPDSKRLAYVIRRGEKKQVPVFGAQEGKEYDEILTWRTPLEDGPRTLGFAFDEKGLPHLIALRDGELLRVELELVKN
jgi:WD40 repeat protein